MRLRIAVFPILVILSGVHSLPAQSQHRTPVVLILLRSSTGTETRSLRALIVDAITVEMEARDIEAVPASNAFTDDSEVFSIAEGRKADFAVSGTFTPAGGSVDLHLRWFDIQQKKTFPGTSLSAPLDLKFDSVIADFIGQMLDDHQEEAASLPAIPPPLPPQEPVKPPEPPRRPSWPNRRRRRKARPCRSRAPEPAPRPRALPRPSPLFFSISSAPFIPVFKASAYVQTVGLSASVEGEYRFPVGHGLLGIVAASGMHYFHAQKVSVADAFVVPVGAGAVDRTLTGSPIDFSLKAEAGPAIFVLMPAGGGSSLGLVPYLSAGMGLTVSFSPHLGASVQLDYIAIMVPDAIMGFTPSVGFNARLRRDADVKSRGRIMAQMGRRLFRAGRFLLPCGLSCGFLRNAGPEERERPGERNHLEHHGAQPGRQAGSV